MFAFVTLRWSLIAGVVVSFALATALESPVARAEENFGVGILVVSPSEGDLSTPIDVTTIGACSRGVAYVVALRGKGIDPDRAGNLVGASMLDRSFPPDAVWYRAPLQSNLGEFFLGEVGRLPRGKYQLVFACRNALDFEWLQTFEATIRFDKDGRYSVLGESGEDPLELLLAKGIVTETDEEYPLPDEEAPDGDGAEPGAQDLAIASMTSEAGAVTLRNGLLVGGAVLLVGAGAAWFVMRRHETQGSGE